MAKKQNKPAPFRARLAPTPNVIIGSRSVANPPSGVPWQIFKIADPPTFQRRMLGILVEASLLGWQVDPRLVAIFL